MKKLLFAVLFFSTALSAQVNDYFVNNPSWVCYRSQYPWPCETVDTVNYFINGDSIINAMTYKAVCRRGHVVDFPMGPPSPIPCIDNYTYQDTVPAGFVRSQGLQMYYIPFTDTAEYLLYDFNLTIGSQIPLTYVNSYTNYTVTSIDSIYTPAGYRTRFFLNGNSFEFLIEGVGSSAGFLEPFGSQFEQTYALLCYSQNDTAYWPAVGPSCSVITDVAVNNADARIVIYPNPSSGKFTCFTGEDNSTLELRNAIGELVFTSTFNTQAEIDLAGFAGGMYACVIRSRENITTEILILQ